MALVLDASVALAWLLPDERSEEASALVRGASGTRFRAPSILLLEVGNALLHAERRHRIPSEVRDELLTAFASLPIVLEPVTADATLRAVTLAARRAFSLYDASYLDLALTRGLPLATFDRALAAAARAEGARVVDAA